MGEYKLYEGRNRSQSLCVKVMEGIFIIPFEEIVYLTSHSNYTTIHKTDGTELVASKTMGKYESNLDDRFIRIHSSTIVNYTKINWISSNMTTLRINTGKMLQIARARKGVLNFLCR